jgi:hypothetical protein
VAAADELAEATIYERWHLIAHVAAVLRRQLPVALKATREGADEPPQLECRRDLLELPRRNMGAQPVSPRHCLTLKQPDIARQQDPPLLRSQASQLGIGQVVAV